MTTTAEAKKAVDLILAQLAEHVDVATLIDRAEGILEIPPAADEVTAANVVHITDPTKADVLNELLARADEVKRIRDAATADYDAIKDVFRKLTGDDRDEVKIHNATVFTNKESVSRILNQSFIKSKFPDIAGNEDFYVDSPRRTALFK